MKKTLTDEEIKAIEEQKAFDGLVQKEKRRTKIEKYKIKQLGNWSMPFNLVFVVYFVYLVGTAIYSKINDIEVSIFSLEWGFLLFLLLFSAIYLGIEEDWEYIQKAKAALAEDSHIAIQKEYENGYIYTDNIFKFLAYQMAKIVMTLFNFSLILLIIYLFTVWIGDSITTSGVIVILLIIIIVLLMQLVINQKNK